VSGMVSDNPVLNELLKGMFALRCVRNRDDSSKRTAAHFAGLREWCELCERMGDCEQIHLARQFLDDARVVLDAAAACAHRDIETDAARAGVGVMSIQGNSNQFNTSEV